MPKVTTNSKLSVKEIEILSYDLRQDVIKMLLESKSGHTAGAIGAADLFAALHFHILEENDHFVLSNGHICPIYYAILARKGIIDESELWKLRKLGAKLEGHPLKGSVPGIETTSGSLAQGLSQAIGMALASKMDKINNRIYCFTGDGELQEGQIWEAAMFAPAKTLDNITWIIDRNNIQIDGNTQNVLKIGNLRNKLESFDWYVIEIDGHNVEEIINSCRMAKSISSRPTAIIAHTVPGKGIDFMEYKFEWHGNTPDKAEAHNALAQLRKKKEQLTKHD